LFIALLAMMAGANDAEAIQTFGDINEEWLRTFLELPNGIPSQDTYLRLLAILDPAALTKVLRDWVQDLRGERAGGHIALDGKTVRGSFDRATGGQAIHMVSAWLVGEGLVLGERKIQDKSNEIVAIPELLSLLDVRETTITLDAMGTQKAIAHQITEQKGSYILPLKENHPNLHKEVADYFQGLGYSGLTPAKGMVDRHEDVDAGHGRVETRTCTLSTDLRSLTQRAEWPGLEGIAMVTRRREDKLSGKTSTEYEYYLVGKKKTSAKEVGSLIRNHWGIENGLHWVLDVTFGEDKCRIRAKNGAENMAVLRHLVMSLMRNAPGKKRSMAKRRQRCGWDRSFLLSVLLQGT
jgi:predicted transposase YbfD/YdcC